MMRAHKHTTRRQHQITKHGAKALAAGAALAAGTQAYAAPIRFENPDHGELGHFHWWDDHLDISLDAVSQAGAGGIKFHQYLSDGSYYGYPYSLVRGTLPNFGELSIGLYYLLSPFAAGQEIPNPDDIFYFSGVVAGVGFPALPEGDDFYLGARINLHSQWHYGWIGVNRQGYELEAFAWGYETGPGVPIAAGAVPEPGTLAMLALGFVGLTAGRHRNG